MKKSTNPTISQQLRQLILSADVSQYAICKACNIDKGHLSRFMHGRGSLSLTTVDKIGAFLNLELKQRKRG